MNNSENSYDQFCGVQHPDVLIRLNTLETRHKANLWFMRILGGAIIILTTTAITIGINLNTTLIKITADQEVCKSRVANVEKTIDRILERNN
jgi:hypothetical protein